MAVHPDIDLLFARKVTFEGVLTRTAIGLVRRYVVLIAVSSAEGSLGLITVVIGVALPIVRDSVTRIAAE